MTDGVNIGGDSPYKIERNLFDMYDALPPELREMIAFAPYPYVVGEIADYYNKLCGAGMSQEGAVKTVKGKFLAMVERMRKAEAMRLYGPDHPQAA